MKTSTVATNEKERLKKKPKKKNVKQKISIQIRTNCKYENNWQRE